MTISIESRLVVLENQKETIARQINSLNPKTHAVEIATLQTELDEIIEAMVDLETEQIINTKNKQDGTAQ